MASHLYWPDGRIEPVVPAGAYWSLEEMQKFVGGYIEVVRAKDGRWMLVNEEGRIHRLPFNQNATDLYAAGSRTNPIVGCVLVVDTKVEFDGPEELTEEEKAL